MKYIFAFALMLCVSVTFAQEKRTLTHNKDTNLIDVVYYHDNGQISQTGSYTLDGKVQGVWNKYDAEGTKLVSAVYEKGEKTGKWFFWDKDVLREVDYQNNDIASVNEWTNKAAIAVRD
ncbi:MAG TPA: hypothetical protein VKZ97_03125 [Flavobacteriaceae bacterium]|nr:hypothetical protein [Flavobacteriaceae bacterium]